MTEDTGLRPLSYQLFWQNKIEAKVDKTFLWLTSNNDYEHKIKCSIFSFLLCEFLPLALLPAVLLPSHYHLTIYLDNRMSHTIVFIASVQKSQWLQFCKSVLRPCPLKGAPSMYIIHALWVFSVWWSVLLSKSSRSPRKRLHSLQTLFSHLNINPKFVHWNP